MWPAKVVLWRPMYHPAGHKMLADGGADVVIVDSADPDQIKQILHGARGLWVRTPERVTREVLDAGKDLVVVSTSGFGTDNIDIKAATERGILVVNHRGFGRVRVSEHAIMLILAAAKQLVWGDRAARDGSAWAKRTGLDLFELDNKIVGIVGIGFIGSEIARKLKHGFRCRVLGYDPYVDARLAPCRCRDDAGSLRDASPEPHSGIGAGVDTRNAENDRRRRIGGPAERRDCGQCGPRTSARSRCVVRCSQPRPSFCRRPRRGLSRAAAFGSPFAVEP